MEWVVDLETEAGVVSDGEVCDGVGERLRAEGSIADCLVAYHPGRGSVAAWFRVDADDAGAALAAAQAALAESLAPTGAKRPPVLAKASVERARSM